MEGLGLQISQRQREQEREEDDVTCGGGEGGLPLIACEE